jgi:hypothetical protein
LLIAAVLGVGCEDQTCAEGLALAEECLETTNLYDEYGHIVQVVPDCSWKFELGTTDGDLNPRDWVFRCIDTSNAEECVAAFEAYDRGDPADNALCADD